MNPLAKYLQKYLLEEFRDEIVNDITLRKVQARVWTLMLNLAFDEVIPPGTTKLEKVEVSQEKDITHIKLLCGDGTPWPKEEKSAEAICLHLLNRKDLHTS